jgi:SM-20-related protein
MNTTEPKTRRVLISGRELFVCDNMIALEVINRIGALVKTLVYRRKEKSRPGVPGRAAVSEIAAAQMSNNVFLQNLRCIAEEVFPGEQLHDQRAYVNSSLYGDSYYIHRDCSENESHVTALYYANLEWETDWGGETIFYNDDYDAELAVSPRPGRVVVSRAAILHRGTVPTRDCYEERLTLAYKLTSSGRAL